MKRSVWLVWLFALALAVPGIAEEKKSEAGEEAQKGFFQVR